MQFQSYTNTPTVCVKIRIYMEQQIPGVPVHLRMPNLNDTIQPNATTIWTVFVNEHYGMGSGMMTPSGNKNLNGVKKEICSRHREFWAIKGAIVRKGWSNARNFKIYLRVISPASTVQVDTELRGALGSMVILLEYLVASVNNTFVSLTFYCILLNTGFPSGWSLLGRSL